MTRPRAVLIVAAIALAACSRHPQFRSRQITLGDRVYRYRVFVPRHYTKVHKWPVILYLHGSGERGDDNVRQLTNGLPVALEKYQGRYRAIVVIPQCRDGEEWYGDEELQALGALEQTIREFNGDRRRIYLTGISMGGAGAWYIARHHEFAAVVPVAGEVSRQPDDPFPSRLPPDLAHILESKDPFGALAAAIGPTPVWAFHGTHDDEIPVTQSRMMFAALKARGGDVRYTEYGNSGHEIWDMAYADGDLAKWLFRQKRR